MIYASKKRGYADGTALEVLTEISTVIDTAKAKLVEEDRLPCDEADCLIEGAVKAGLRKNDANRSAKESEEVTCNE